MAARKVSKACSTILIAAAMTATPASAGPNDNRDGATTVTETAYAPNPGEAVSPAPRSPGSTLAIQTMDQSPRGNPLSAIPLSVLSETRERPVFSASRWPPTVARVSASPPSAPPVAPAAPDLHEPPPLTLLGTIVNGASPVAIVKSASSEVVSSVRIGEENLGWRLKSVAARSILVEKGDHSVTLGFPAPQDSNGAQASPSVSLRDTKRGQH